MSCDGCVALLRGAMGLSAVCDCGISWSYSLFSCLLSIDTGLAIYDFMVQNECPHQVEYLETVIKKHL